MKKYSVLHKSVLFQLAAIILSLPLTAQAAQTPWKWQFSLQADPKAGVMVMPSALYVDTARQRYYVVDAGNNRLVSFDRDGKFLNVFTAKNSLRTPFDMTRTSDGKLWVVEKKRNTLTRIDLKSQEITPNTLRNGKKTVFPDRLEPEGDSFYVLDKISGSILVYDRKLHVRRRINCPDCAAGFIDFKVRDGAVWALEPRKKVVYHFNAAGKIQARIKLGKAVQFPSSVARDSSGFLYVLDRHDGRVAVFDRKGKFKYRFLGPGHVRGRLYYPVELRFDPWGRLCVVDEGNGRVEVFGR